MKPIREQAEEMFDKYSQFIDSDIDSLKDVAGTDAMFRRDFLKCFDEFAAESEKEIARLKEHIGVLQQSLKNCEDSKQHPF